MCQSPLRFQKAIRGTEMHSSEKAFLFWLTRVWLILIVRLLLFAQLIQEIHYLVLWRLLLLLRLCLIGLSRIRILSLSGTAVRLLTSRESAENSLYAVLSAARLCVLPDQRTENSGGQLRRIR